MDDQTLLKRYVGTGDSAAFEELVRRFANLVKVRCIRVLGNTHDAEEVAQECFLELARHADQVHSSVGGWLHRAATSRSLNVLRSRSRRKVRETEVSVNDETAATEANVTNRELQRIVNGALTEMPEDLRLPMLLHFFDGHSQRDVAVELGVNQSTISRRMRDALQRLREKLTQAGYVSTAPAVMVMMQEQTAKAASDSMLAHAVAGPAGNAAGCTAIGTAFKSLIAALLSIFVFLFFGGWISLLLAIGVTVYVGRFRPRWMADVFSSLGVPDLYDQPAFCLSRWTWTAAPVNWRSQLLSSSLWSALFFGLALIFATGTEQPPWGIVILGLVVSAGMLFHGLRLIRQVCLTTSVRSAMSTGVEQPVATLECLPAAGPRTGCPDRDHGDHWFDAIQQFGILAGIVGMAVQLSIRPQISNVWPSIILCGMFGCGIFLQNVWPLFRRLQSHRQDTFASESIHRRNGLVPRLAAVSSWHSRGLSSAAPVEVGSTYGRLASDAINERNQLAYTMKGSRRIWSGSHSVIAIGTCTVVMLSGWIFWNPGAIRAPFLSLAAIQTSILGWMVYRLTVHCRGLDLRNFYRAAIALLIGCFVLNSGVCVAQWIQ